MTRPFPTLASPEAREFLTRLGDQMIHRGMCQGLQQADALDAAQETMVALIGAYPSFSGTAADLMRFGMRIHSFRLKRVYVDLARRRREVPIPEWLSKEDVCATDK